MENCSNQNSTTNSCINNSLASCAPNCQIIVCHDWETSFCGCKQCKRCFKREYGSGCGYLNWPYTSWSYTYTLTTPYINPLSTGTC